MIKDKKKILYIAIATALVIVIAIGTVLVLKSFNKTDSINQNQTVTPITEKTLDDQMLQVVQSLHSDPAKARALLVDLGQKYKDLGNTNGVVDVQAQLYMLDHPEIIK